MAETLAHSEAQDAQYRWSAQEVRRRDSWTVPLALVLLGLAGILALAQPRWMTGDPRLAVTRADLERGVLAAIYLQAQQIEVFRLREGRLPESLDEVRTPISGIRFVRSNSYVYQLVAQGPEGGSVIYDSARPGPEFDAVAAPWTAPYDR